MIVRLFQLYDSKENKVVDGAFTNKPAAKTKRRELNAFTDEGKEIIRFRVIPGPDHHRYKENRDGKNNQGNFRPNQAEQQTPSQD